MIRREEDLKYCMEQGKELEDREDYDDICDFVGAHDNIEEMGGIIYWDWISGINYYGEIRATVRSYKDGRFSIEKNGITVDGFKNYELRNALEELAHC